ncbi:MAG TPA: hypothetical protein VNK50_13095 [Calidithermus sp.]|nr:hypothetical protein [Calidithermus sp.]
MAFATSRVLRVPAVLTADAQCHFHIQRLCCVPGQPRYYFLRREHKIPFFGALDPDAEYVALYRSTDDGQTWTLRSTVTDMSMRQLWGTALFAPGGGADRLLVGTYQKSGVPYGPYALIPRSEDGGLTWQSAVTADTYARFTLGTYLLAHRTLGFVRVPPATVLALGEYEVENQHYHVLRSTDGGQTFEPLSGTEPWGYALEFAVALSADLIIAAPELGDRIWRSTDGGQSWQAVPVPGMTAPGQLASLGGQSALLFGGSKLWRTSDGGQSWSLISTVPDLTSAVTRLLISLDGANRMVGLATHVSQAVLRWALSEDGGQSWTFSTVTDTQTPYSSSQSLVATGLGAILTAVNAPSHTGNWWEHFGEVWRGTITGFTGPSTCDLVLLSAAAPMAPPLECVPAFGGPLCPHVCPPEPEQPPGQLVAPLTTAPGGFAAPVPGWLRFGRGPDITPALLGRPAACGPMFTSLKECPHG